MLCRLSAELTPDGKHLPGPGTLRTTMLDNLYSMAEDGDFSRARDILIADVTSTSHSK